MTAGLAATPAPAAASSSTPAIVATTPGCAGPARPGVAVCVAIRATPAVRALGVTPHFTPSGYGPKDLRNAYKLNTASGVGSTIAIVSAYNDPSAAPDLAVYRAQYGLLPCTVASGCFRQVNQTGGTSPLPPDDPSWAAEDSLQLDMVSAVCPSCHLLLVEASSASMADLLTAVDEAVALGAKTIAIGWAGVETPSEVAYDAHFNRPGVAITAPSGDGSVPEYPAASRYVTAVGGTTLFPAANARGWGESAWSGSGSGCSLYESKPPWQTTVVTTCNRRALSDVAAVADPETGVAVYQKYGGSGWEVFGGNSVASAIIAGVYGLAGGGVSGYPASYPYAHPGNLFDIVTGSNGGCGAPLCQAGPGWDGPTGLGTPDGVRAFRP